jgi:hypothetical protein
MQVLHILFDHYLDRQTVSDRCESEARSFRLACVRIEKQGWECRYLQGGVASIVAGRTFCAGSWGDLRNLSWGVLPNRGASSFIIPEALTVVFK